MNVRQEKIAALCDGKRTSKQIAQLVGDSAKYVQRTMLAYDLPRRAMGAQPGADNHAYKTGRRIDRDGYVIVTAPARHPHARYTEGRNLGIILEHRLIMENELGRYLAPLETVDHVDGLRLHNDPSNLRLFESNAAHLKATITGQTPQWSQEGVEKQYLAPSLRASRRKVNTYSRMKKSGDARLRQILLAALSLGIDSPYLSGSSHHLEKAGIVDFSHSSLKRALADLYQQYA